MWRFSEQLFWNSILPQGWCTEHILLPDKTCYELPICDQNNNKKTKGREIMDIPISSILIRKLLVIKIQYMLGVKCDEPNSRQTVFSSFLIWFTDSSSGINIGSKSKIQWLSLSKMSTRQNSNLDREQLILHSLFILFPIIADY